MDPLPVVSPKTSDMYRDDAKEDDVEREGKAIFVHAKQFRWPLYNDTTSWQDQNEWYPSGWLATGLRVPRNGERTRCRMELQVGRQNLHLFLQKPAIMI